MSTLVGKMEREIIASSFFTLQNIPFYVVLKRYLLHVPPNSATITIIIATFSSKFYRAKL